MIVRSQLLCCTLLLSVFSCQVLASTDIGFAMVKTANAGPTPEAVLVESGSWFKLRQLAQNAVLIRHPKGDVLIDSGLGKKVDEQFAQNSFLHRQLFKYSDVFPAVEQFKQAQYDPHNIKTIIPTHLHWDHASGLVDFPQAKVWVQAVELDEALNGQAPGHLHSQFPSSLQWQFITLRDQPYKGYERSLDVYGDGSIVLVDVSGHTAGQLGVFLTTSSAKQYFFSGDTTWTTKGIKDVSERGTLLRWLLEINWNHDKNAAQIHKLSELQKREPELTIVPAHDESILSQLPIYPQMRY